MQSHSTGLPEMDWFMTDRWETPAGVEHLYSERLLRLPDGYVCYSPPSYAPEVGSSPASVNGYVTFGCFNNLAKLTPLVIATWARILATVPASRLILKTHQFGAPETCDRRTAAFEAAGVAPRASTCAAHRGHRAFLRQ